MIEKDPNFKTSYGIGIGALLKDVFSRNKATDELKKNQVFANIIDGFKKEKREDGLDIDEINERFKNAPDGLFNNKNNKNHIYTGDGEYVIVTKKEYLGEVRDPQDIVNKEVERVFGKRNDYDDYFVSEDNFENDDLIMGDVDSVSGMRLEDDLAYGGHGKENLDIDDLDNR